MHRRQHEVAGERRLHGDLRGFRVADLAHHDLVRIVPEDRTQSARKGQSLLLVDRYLQHPGQLVFHRVFDRDDLVVAGMDFGDGGIECGCLAASGRAGDEQHPVGCGGEVTDGRKRPGIEAEDVQCQCGTVRQQLFLVQDPQHRILAMDAWHDRHAQVDLAAGHADLEAPILRHAALRDIEFGQHLEPRDHLFSGFAALQPTDGIEHAIDTVFDMQSLMHALDMDVAGTRLERVVERGIDDLDDRAAVFRDGRQ